MQMKKKKYNYTYKITNIINNKVYYGKHSTNNINDKYGGSYGMALQYDMKKYGIDNFKFEIDKIFSTEIDALKYETKIVNKDYISRNDTYNVITGGTPNRSLFKKRIKNNDIKYVRIKMSQYHHDILKKEAKRHGKSIKHFIIDFIETLGPTYKLKLNQEFIESNLDYSNWQSTFKRVKISVESHGILKKYCKKHGLTMKWVLNNFIKTELQEQSYGIKLKVDKNNKII